MSGCRTSGCSWLRMLGLFGLWDVVRVTDAGALDVRVQDVRIQGLRGGDARVEDLRACSSSGLGC